MGTPSIAEVVVETGGVNLQKSLYYEIPERISGKIFVGSRVLVPLGKRKVTGFVVGITSNAENINIKEIIEPLDEKPVFTEEQLKIARWISGYYMSSPQRSLQAIAHPGLHKTKMQSVKYYYPNFSPEKLDDYMHELNRAKKQAAVLDVAVKSPGLTKKQLSLASGASFYVVDALIKKGLLKTVEKPVDNYPGNNTGTTGAWPELTGEQKAAVEDINRYMDKGSSGVFLLHGVTGSGKTEVYLNVIKKSLSQKKPAIVLIPEISLTSQMIRCFRERLGSRVALLHSRMSAGERYGEWERIFQGKADVVLGARSAIFAPVHNPGVIIIDEEHEFTYKQEESPRYHARAVALYRAHINNSVVVLGSATPSLESYCRAVKNGPYNFIEMKKRVDNIPMPKVKTVDMRREFKNGNKGIFSSDLYKAVWSRLENKEQVILFLNRRGFNTFVVCHECGLVLKCPNCDISLTYHYQGRIRCHYCNYSQIAPGLCPECRSNFIYYYGTGTQKVEKEAAELFSGARILRMDADTTGRKDAHRKILESFENGEADVLIGTQMIAKGLNLPGVTLVGIINADTSLYIPDFRSSERTFQLMTQVSGRAGRSEKSGEVVIQTFNPEHYAITAVTTGDQGKFYTEEMQVRKEMQYPPYTRMTRLLFFGRKEEKVGKLAETALETIRDYLDGPEGIISVGPAPAPLSKVRGNYRLHMVLWSKKEKNLREAVKKISEVLREMVSGRDAGFIIDIDPYNMM